MAESIPPGHQPDISRTSSWMALESRPRTRHGPPVLGSPADGISLRVEARPRGHPAPWSSRDSAGPHVARLTSVQERHSPGARTAPGSPRHNR